MRSKTVQGVGPASALPLAHLRVPCASGRLAAKRLLARSVALVLLVSLVLAAVPAPLVRAAPISVCGTGCDYQTIQEAIDNAVAGDIILVEDPVHTEAGISVTEDVTIRGQGAPNTIVQAAATPGTATDRVFRIENGATVTIEDMIIRHGYERQSGGGTSWQIQPPVNGPVTKEASISSWSKASGGGIYVALLGALTVNRCTITANQVEVTVSIEASASAESNDSDATATATAEASADAYGGAIANEGLLTVNQSTVSGNQAIATIDAKAHAFASSGGVGATVTQTPEAKANTHAHGGIYNAGIMLVVNSTVSGNQASADSDALADNDVPPPLGLADRNVRAAGSRGPGGEALGRSVVDSGDDWVRAELTCGPDGVCVEVRDQAWQPGSAGPDPVAAQAPTAPNDTKAIADATGGIYNADNALKATVRYSTVFDNGSSASASASSTLSASDQAQAIGGVQNRGTLELDSSIVALQRSGPDCGGDSPIRSVGANLDSDGTCNLDPSLGDQANIDPLLGPLQDNGGPTETHALSYTSPALEQISVGSRGCGTKVDADQRGIMRPQGAECDIGAYEAQYFTLTVSTTGGGSGSVMGSGISCGSDCTETYPEGTVVTLTASADTGSTFGGWSGDCTGATNCAVTMTAARTVTATFDIKTAYRVFLPVVNRNVP